LFGEKLRVASHAKILADNEIVCQRSDGSRVVLPIWMLDPKCSEIVVGLPLISIEALVELRQLLSAVRARGKAGMDETSTRTTPTPTATTQPDAGRCEPGGTAKGCGG